MRNNIISLEKYFSIFAYLSAVWLQFGQNALQKFFLHTMDFALIGNQNVHR